MSPAELVLDRIEHDLVAGITSYQGRRRRQRQLLTGAAAAVVLALLAIGLTGLRGTSPQSALAITASSDSLTVRVNDAAAAPGDMTAELQDAGANVLVQAEPVPPDAVGHWIASGTLGPGSPSDVAAIAADLARQIRMHPDYVTIPKHSAIRLWLVVGRSVRDGEQPCLTPTTVIVSPTGEVCDSKRSAPGPATGP